MIVIVTDEGLPEAAHLAADVVIKNGVVVKSRTGKPRFLSLVQGVTIQERVVQTIVVEEQQ